MTIQTLAPDAPAADAAAAAAGDPAPPSDGGATALVSAGIVVLGAVFAAHPNSTLARALHGVLPQLAPMIPAAVTAVAAVVAAFAHPPHAAR